MSKGPWQLLFFKSFLGFFLFFFFIFYTQILLTIHILANGLGNHLHTQINTLFNKTDYTDDLGHHSYNQKISLIIQETLFANNYYTILRHKFTKKFIQKIFFTKTEISLPLIFDQHFALIQSNSSTYSKTTITSIKDQHKQLHIRKSHNKTKKKQQSRHINHQKTKQQSRHINY
jgi:hypothetical protein